MRCVYSLCVDLNVYFERSVNVIISCNVNVYMVDRIHWARGLSMLLYLAMLTSTWLIESIGELKLYAGMVYVN